MTLSDFLLRELRAMDPAKYEELDAIGERLLTARSLEDALGGQRKVQ